MLIKRAISEFLGLLLLYGRPRPDGEPPKNLTAREALKCPYGGAEGATLRRAMHQSLRALKQKQS